MSGGFKTIQKRGRAPSQPIVPVAFTECLTLFVKAVCPELAGRLVAIDGKTVPKLPSLPKRNEAAVGLHALGSQRKIALMQAGADYLLALKEEPSTRM